VFVEADHRANAPNTAFQADRFAREIDGSLALSYAARSRRLNAKPLAGDCHPSPTVSPFTMRHNSTPSRLTVSIQVALDPPAPNLLADPP
jgi:hypothetical protein